MHLSCVLVCGALSRKILLDFSAVSCVLVLKLVRERVLHFHPHPIPPTIALFPLPLTRPFCVSVCVCVFVCAQFFGIIHLHNKDEVKLRSPQE